MGFNYGEKRVGYGEKRVGDCYEIWKSALGI